MTQSPTLHETREMGGATRGSNAWDMRAILRSVDRYPADGRQTLGCGSEMTSRRGVAVPAEYCGAPCWSLEGIPPWPTLTVVLRYWSRTTTLP